jgi:predicted CXXCH cytochrome family protein
MGMNTEPLNPFFKRGLGCITVLAVMLIILPEAWGVHDKVQCATCLDQLIIQTPTDAINPQSDSKSAICLACHDARLDDSGLNPPHVVYGGTDLAGGSFTSTLQSDKTGHNVYSVDMTLGPAPPGGYAESDLSCLSCHDPHKNGNYRNLKKEVNGRPTAVMALGDPDYQKNVYISGMNAFCGACHEKFYGDSGAGGSHGWVSHPVDIPISGAEHADYRHWSMLENRITRVETPSGNPDNVYDARVFCLSCHRAHASPYNDALRWDYSRDAEGCLECHTF